MMRPTVRIRRARAGDAAAIARVHVETWRAAYAGCVPDDYLVRMTERGQAFFWRKHLSRRRPDAAVLVAEVSMPEQAAGDVVVGFGSCGRRRSSDLPYTGEVYTLYVAQDWQGRGVGRKLLGELFRTLDDGGLPDCLIWVLAANPARFFYERMGGRRAAERQDAFAGHMLEEVAYVWPDLRSWLDWTEA